MNCMKENVFDVLMYLYDNYLTDDNEITTDEDSLKNILTHAGFGDIEVDKAFEWLESLTPKNKSIQTDMSMSTISHRIFNSQEMEKLSTDCRGMLAFLEQAKILDAQDRELVIDRVMALESGDIDLYQLKWVVLMVLLNQPGKEGAYAWMEEVVMDQQAAALH